MRSAAMGLALSLLAATSCLAAEPFARASVDDDGQIVPGQQVHVIVDVFVPDFFTSPPQFPLFDLPNAVVTLANERPQNLLQTIDGVQYSGIRRTYAVVPEVLGTFTLPSVPIELGYSEDGRRVKGTVQLPSIGFNVIGSASGQQTPAFAARQIALTQSFDRNPSQLKVGDAIVRTVTVFGEDTQAMMIPQVVIGEAAGLRQYQKPPQIADNIVSGNTTGSRRIETIVYTADKAGTFRIPAVSYPWFDVDAHQARTTTLPTVAVTVIDAPASSDIIAPELRQETAPSRSRTLTAAALASGCALCVAVLWAGRRFLPRFSNGMRAWRRPRPNSEHVEFKRLMNSIAGDEESAVYQALMRWTRVVGYSSISTWMTASSDPDLRSQIEAIEKALFGSGTDGAPFDRQALADAVRRSHIAKPAPGSLRGGALPPLNPGAASPTSVNLRRW
ncbi:BatD family protein [Rhizobium sp. CNPSo 3464]|uniref:BatD family protein n=1 Tax=Rhizobium sp. CNPSo 3464 TaxID=3021406 RepID=UPI002551982A|nr:BatD family protein [Rhizobium sp. CNPSo 3464]MDK4742517.1 BatD family protein [Rhizobium sp. CNPSo 3464]